MDDASLIATLQLADSFFPSGTVTLSHGLETFVAKQPISAREIQALLENYLHGKVTPSDLVAYAHAYRAAEGHSVEQLRAIDHQFTASLWAQDLRQASMRSGRALLHTAEPLIESLTLQQFADDVRTGCSDGNAVVCFGLVCSLWQIPIRTGGITHLYTFAVSFLGAAMRLGCLGHRETQRILLALRPQFSTLVDEALMRELDEMSTFAPLADIRAMQHASLSVRLFAS